MKARDCNEAYFGVFKIFLNGSGNDLNANKVVNIWRSVARYRAYVSRNWRSTVVKAERKPRRKMTNRQAYLNVVFSPTSNGVSPFQLLALVCSRTRFMILFLSGCWQSNGLTSSVVALPIGVELKTFPKQIPAFTAHASGPGVCATIFSNVEIFIVWYWGPTARKGVASTAENPYTSRVIWKQTIRRKKKITTTELSFFVIFISNSTCLRCKRKRNFFDKNNFKPG